MSLRCLRKGAWFTGRWVGSVFALLRLTCVQYQLEERGTKEAQTGDGGEEPTASKSQEEKMGKLRRKAKVVVDHVDIIKDEFWERRPWILSNRPGKLPVGD